MFGKRGSQSGNVNPPAPVQPAKAEPQADGLAAPPPPAKPAPVATLLDDNFDTSPAKPVAIDPPRPPPRIATPEPAAIRRSENFYDIKSTVFSALIDTIDLSQLARLDNEWRAKRSATSSTTSSRSRTS